MALVPDQKFSTFFNGGDLQVNDIIVGLRDGVNTRFTYTGDLPVGVVVPIANGGTGATTAPTARANLGLGSADSPTFTALNLSSAIEGVTAIQSSTGLNILGFATVASAVNYLTISNQIAGQAPIISVAGSDTNISLAFTAKGNGVFYHETTASNGVFNVVSGTAYQHSSDFNFPNTAGSQTYTYPDATGTISLDAQVQRSLFNFAASTGVNDAFVVTLTPAPAALTDGLLVTMYSGTLYNTTSAATLNVNGLGAKPIVTFAGALAPEDIETGSNYLFIYNAADDNFQLLNPFITTADTFLVQQNAYNYAIDTGIVNAYIADILPNNASLIDGGMPIVMQAAHNNTAASTLTVNGITKSIATSAGSALVGGEILANQVYYFLYNNSSDKFILINSTGYATKIQVQESAFNTGLDTGVADAYIVDLTPAVGALTDGLLITFTALNQNDTNSPTLTVNGITKNIVNQSGGVVSITDIPGDTPSYLMYAESQDYWMLLNASVSNVQANYLQNALYYSATDAGAANAYDVTLDFGVAIGSFSPSYGSQVYFNPANTNTAPSTLVVNSQGPTVIITMDGSTLRAGTIVAGVEAWFVFGKNMAGSLGWILMNPQGGTNQNGGLTAVSVSGTSKAMTAGHAYIFNNAGATTGTLPTSATSVIGDVIKVKGRSSAAWIIQANTSQVIKLGSVSSSAAGTATSAAGSDSIQLVYVAADEWSVDWALSSAIVLA